VAYPARLVAELIGDAFIEAIERSRHNSFEGAHKAWRWLLESAEAPPGIELVAPDGSTYTGFVFVERSRAVLLLALRQAPRASRMHGEHWGRDDSVRHPRLFDENDLAPDERNPLYRR
jgi:hypothetical protein